MAYFWIILIFSQVVKYHKISHDITFTSRHTWQPLCWWSYAATLADSHASGPLNVAGAQFKAKRKTIWALMLQVTVTNLRAWPPPLSSACRTNDICSKWFIAHIEILSQSSVILQFPAAVSYRQNASETLQEISAQLSVHCSTFVSSKCYVEQVRCLCISVPTMPPMHSPLCTPTRQLAKQSKSLAA